MRAIPLVLCLLAGWSVAAAAEPPAGPKMGPRATPPANPFEVSGWVTLDPVNRNLIRSPAMDVEAKEDEGETHITVYGRKRRPDVGPRRPGGYEPLDNTALVPRVIPIGPPSSCSRGAYETVAGQPATGNDLVGALGGGRC